MDKEDYTEYWIAYYLVLIAPPILFVVGILGNILSIVVFVRVRTMISGVVFLSVLAACNILVLCTVPLRTMIMHLFDFDIAVTHDVVCKLMWLFNYSAGQFSSELLMIVTLEKALTLWIPLRIRMVFTFKRAIILVSVMGVTLLLLNCHLLYGVGVVNRDQLERHENNVTVNSTVQANILGCNVVHPKYKPFFKNVWKNVDLVLRFALPCVMIFIGNIAIIIRLQKRRKFHRQSVVDRGNDTRDITLRITSKVLAVSIVFLVCMMPIYIMTFIGPKIISKLEHAHQEAVTLLIRYISVFLLYVNYSVSFILYSLLGTRFRQEVVAMFCKSCAKSNDTKTAPLAKLSAASRETIDTTC